MADQGVDRRLPFRIGHFLRNAFVGDNARIMLGKRYEYQDAAAVLCVGDAANHELLDRGVMRAGALRRTRNEQKP